ncbi:MAG: phosphoribosyl-ATP diphosphatase [Anaerolineales bacterium]|nr:phosphoribosyl-ATP diphosphatase [Anaerolineales bacterium]
MLKKLSEIIEDRKQNQPAGSYTVELLQAGEDKVLKKVGEEAMEVILAAKGQGKQRLVEETADLLYHLLVMLASYDLSLTDVEEELRKRHG